MAYAGDWTTDAGGYNVGKKILGEAITLARYIDCTSKTVSNASFYKLFSVPANFQVENIYIVNGTGEGAADTIDITDDDVVTTTFVNDASVETAGVITRGTARKVYAAAGFICLLANADITAAKFWVVVTGQILNTNM
jgi:hypothetical protein